MAAASVIPREATPNIISWSHNSQESHLISIETKRLILRPVKEQDREHYRALFKNTVATEKYQGSFSDPRFNRWAERWKEHNFSALAIYHKTEASTEFVGHAILGHGDYDGSSQGFSEIAYITDPKFWNHSHGNEKKDVGTKGMKGIGTEIVSAIMAYAKSIFEEKIKVPADLEDNSTHDLKGKQIYFEKDKAHAVYVELSEIRATCQKTNKASEKILDKAFKIEETIGKKTEGERGYHYSIKTKDL